MRQDLLRRQHPPRDWPALPCMGGASSQAIHAGVTLTARLTK